MKRKNREINIFSMSALDLFASALGAFILIMLILMPYYLKTTPVPPVCPPCKKCKVCPPPGEQGAPAPPVIMDKLMLIKMYWNRRGDIDLYVKAPNGTYFYKNKVIAPSQSILILDDEKGGRKAKELWVGTDPVPGVYNVCFKHYKGNRFPFKVWGQLQKPSGPVNIPPVRLNRYKQEICVLKFRLSDQWVYEQL